MGLFSTTPEWQRALANWRGIQDAPAEENRQHIKGIRVLENAFLEKYFATSHWIMPGVWFTPVIAFFVWTSVESGMTWSTLCLCLVAGALGWTLVEYVLHRFVFHFPETKLPFLRTTLFAMHGYHHEFPADPKRLVAPPVLAWPIATLLGLLYWAAFGPYWQALLAGTFLGYLGYDWMHYYTHHAVPKNRFGKFMRRFHLEHHFKTSTRQFGLSSPIWDYAFFSFRRPAGSGELSWEEGGRQQERHESLGSKTPRSAKI